MKTACLMLVTNIPSRLPLVEKNIASIEKANGNGFLDCKVLSIDLFEKHPKDLKPFQKYEALGWKLVTGMCTGHRGMLNNMIRGLHNTPRSDFLFYVEDDVLIDRLPGRNCLEGLREANLGFICLNTHINGLDKPYDKAREQFINDKQNYKRFGNDLFLVKKPCLRDEYYLNFPSAIIRDELFRQLIEYAANNCSRVGIEPGLTRSWFALGLDQKYDVGVFVKPDTLSHLPLNFDKFHHMANMQFWNNGYQNPTINRHNTIF